MFFKRKKAMPATPKKLKVRTHFMKVCDLEEVLAIENECFADPWSEEKYVQFVRQINRVEMVAKHDARVVGFLLYDSHEHYLHLQRIAVAVDKQAAGIGRQMMEKLISNLSGYRHNKITVNVRETDMNALLFFKAMEFRAVHSLRDHYVDTGEDAVVMKYLKLPY